MMTNMVLIDREYLKEYAPNLYMMTINELVEKTCMSNNTILNFRESKKPVRYRSALLILKAARIPNPEAVLTNTASEELEIFDGWQIEGENVFCDQIRGFPCAVRKVLEPATGRVGRGKKFSLQNCGSEELEIIEHELNRNPFVCARLERSLYFPLLYQSGFTKNRETFWVIEKWEDAESLYDLVINGQLEKSRVPYISLELAKALKTLNDAGFVRRYLTPKSIFLRPDGSLFLRDLETATFIEEQFRKSRDFEVSREVYFAPELEKREISELADVYSWAQTVIFCLHGKTPPSNQTGSFFRELPAIKPISLGLLEIVTARDPGMRRKNGQLLGFAKIIEALEKAVA